MKCPNCGTHVDTSKISVEFFKAQRHNEEWLHEDIKMLYAVIFSLVMTNGGEMYFLNKYLTHFREEDNHRLEYYNDEANRKTYITYVDDKELEKRRLIEHAERLGLRVVER